MSRAQPWKHIQDEAMPFTRYQLRDDCYRESRRGNIEFALQHAVVWIHIDTGDVHGIANYDET